MSLPGDPGIGSGLANLLSISHESAYSKKFPDGEVYIRLLRRVEREKVLLVQSMYPDQNDRLVELLLTLELLNRYENRVNLLITYLAYARQDKEFLGGEAVSLRSIIKALLAQGVEALITVDAHNPLAVEEIVRGTKYVNLLPGEIFAEVLSKKYGGRKATVIAPDQGAAQRASSLAGYLGCGYLVVQKMRDRVTGQVEHVFSSLNRVPDLAVIVDDIISTGGTIAGIASHLSNRGVEVVVATSHGLFVGDAYEKLVKSGVREIYAIPTVLRRLSNVVYLDIVPYLAKKLREEGVLE